MLLNLIRMASGQSGQRTVARWTVDSGVLGPVLYKRKTSFYSVQNNITYIGRAGLRTTRKQSSVLCVCVIM